MSFIPCLLSWIFWILMHRNSAWTSSSPGQKRYFITPVVDPHFVHWVKMWQAISVLRLLINICGRVSFLLNSASLPTSDGLHVPSLTIHALYHDIELVNMTIYMSSIWYFADIHKGWSAKTYICRGNNYDGLMWAIAISFSTNTPIRDLTVLDTAWSVVHRGNLSYFNNSVNFPIVFCLSSLWNCSHFYVWKYNFRWVGVTRPVKCWENP